MGWRSGVLHLLWTLPVPPPSALGFQLPTAPFEPLPHFRVVCSGTQLRRPPWGGD